MADRVVDCHGCIVAPGFIDLQINGAFGVDFSCDITDRESGEKVLRKIGQGILAHGVTAYCPTVVTSPPSVYCSVLPNITPAAGGLHGAAVLGVHVEGPFISSQKKGAHPAPFFSRLGLIKNFGPSRSKHTPKSMNPILLS